MKHLAVLLFSLFSVIHIYSQEITTLNMGETRQTDYYTSIPYQKLSGLYIVRVEIAGTEYDFLFDTGAATSISQEIVDKINPRTLLEKLNTTDNDVKSDSLPVYNLDEIVVGGVVFNDIPAIVLPESEVKTCFKIDGIVGSNLMRNSIIRFSTSDQTIILTDQPDRLDLASKEQYATEMLLTPNQSSPYIWTALTDKDTGGIQLMFDSGMMGFYDLALDHLKLFTEHDVFSEEPAVAVGSHTYGFFGRNSDTLQYRFRIPQLDICSAVFKNATIHTTPSDNSRMGIELLDYGTVTIDFMNKLFYFEPSFEAEKDLYSKMQPVSLSMEDGKLVIGTLWDKELEGKISVGDRVISIDETNFENMEECELFLYDFSDEKESNLFRLRAKDGTEKEILIEEK